MKHPYGSWKSPISSDLIVAESIGVSGPTLHQEGLFWLESRPREGGRNVLVLQDSDGDQRDINPAPFDIRTRVHEYGGGAWLLLDDAVIFSNFADQQLYRQTFASKQPQPLTHEPELRFANGLVDAWRNRIIAVIEDHGRKNSSQSLEAENMLGAIDLADGSVNILARGHDFFASPALSPDGRHLAWITWEHPDMPWDETLLWLADINDAGLLTNLQSISGGKVGTQKISVQQPGFSPSGELYFISDKSGWWNLYRAQDPGKLNIYPLEAEFGLPQWVFGQTTYRFLNDNQILCTYGVNNQNRLATVNLSSLTVEELPSPYSSIHDVDCSDQSLVYVGASPTEFSSIVRQNLQSHDIDVVKRSTTLSLDEGYLSKPETIEFPTAGDESAHGFFYPPVNKDFQAPDGEKPPLLLMLHGGPTSATTNGLNLRIQYWTSRGIAVLDLNYRGSTGYGRRYRDKLLGNWGIVDVEDCVAACRYLGEEMRARQRVDKHRLAIRGGSAGGYTTLSALTFTETFKAGASHFGVSDLEALAKDTHKFESRYLDSIVGPYPERLDLYRARSPIHHVDQLSSACIFFQGLEDKVVPPSQAELMVKALDAKGLPVAYVAFEGEQHGFRRAENIKRCLDLELYFYARIFSFSCNDDDIEPVEIRNLPKMGSG